MFLSPGVVTGKLLQPTDTGSHWLRLKDGQFETTDGTTGPDKDGGRVCATAAVCRKGRKWQCQGKTCQGSRVMSE